MYRHHPTWVEAVRLVREGRIGDLQAVHTFFSYYNDDASNIRNRTETGGGALMDIGCYAINAARLLVRAEPVDVVGSIRRDPAMGVDTLSSAVLTFPSGAQSSFTVGIRSEPYQRVHVVGSQGRIEVEIPFNIPAHLPTRLHVSAGGDPPVAPMTETLAFQPVDQYAVQAELFGQAVLDAATAPVDPADAVANMRVIDALLDL